MSFLESREALASKGIGKSVKRREDARQRKIRPQLFVVKIIALFPLALGPKR